MVIDGEEFGFAGGGGVIDRDGEKFPFNESIITWGIDQVAPGRVRPARRASR